MKTFLYKLILFLPPVFLFPLFLYFSFVYVENNVQSKIKNIVGYECLIMRDYQMKLKMVLANGNNIKRVILGVSANNFESVYLELVDLKFIEGKSSPEKYLYFVDPLDNPLFDIKDIFYQKNFISGVFLP